MATPKPPLVSNLPVLVSLIEQRIYLIRGKKVMLSNDLAELYQVEVRTLVQAIKHNVDRFPADFMFPAQSERARQLEITNCDFKLGWCAQQILRFH
jgi:ORF6N domain